MGMVIDQSGCAGVDDLGGVSAHLKSFGQFLGMGHADATEIYRVQQLYLHVYHRSVIFPGCVGYPLFYVGWNSAANGHRIYRCLVVKYESEMYGRFSDPLLYADFTAGRSQFGAMVVAFQSSIWSL